MTRSLLAASAAALLVLASGPGWAGTVSGTAGTNDVTIVDPPNSSQWPHFTCSGCGGGGGGAVTGALSSFVDGWNVTGGSLGDAACGTDNGSCSAQALWKRNNQRITSLIAALGSPLQAGGSIGNTGFAATSTVTQPSLAPTITAGAYSTGNVLGGLLQFTAQPATGFVQSATLVLASGTYTGTADLFLFSANPSGSTVADHGAFLLASADAAKVMGVIHLTDSTAAGGALSVTQGTSAGEPVVLGATTVFAVLVLRGAVTPAGTTDATVSLGVVK